jgi:hypothetical protein
MVFVSTKTLGATATARGARININTIGNDKNCFLLPQVRLLQRLVHE